MLQRCLLNYNPSCQRTIKESVLNAQIDWEKEHLVTIGTTPNLQNKDETIPLVKIISRQEIREAETEKRQREKESRKRRMPIKIEDDHLVVGNAGKLFFRRKNPKFESANSPILSVNFLGNFA